MKKLIGHIKIAFSQLKFLFWKIMAKFSFSSKNKPKAKVIIDWDFETNERVGDPYIIIVDGRNNTLEAPFFSSIPEAEAWIEKYLLENKDTNAIE